MLQPTKISKTEKNEIRFDWNDGSCSEIALRDLRLACPCALCVDEFSGKPILDPSSVPKDILIETLRSIGRYAVGITWTDGHASGIYPYRLLKDFSENKK
ncbi:MAG: DUF971 domain-containing protein [Fibrobacter sp.]|nr:DUF971 domain-containing protein [Fibrobacter sp.]